MQLASTFQIYNASAGSGKTFTLVKEYLKIILISDDIFIFQMFCGDSLNSPPPFFFSYIPPPRGDLTAAIPNSEGEATSIPSPTGNV